MGMLETYTQHLIGENKMYNLILFTIIMCCKLMAVAGWMIVYSMPVYPIAIFIGTLMMVTGIALMGYSYKQIYNQI